MVPHPLLQNNPLAVILAVLLLVGAVLWIVGAMVVRKVDQQAEIDYRLDMVERLMLVGQPWCVTDLEKIRTEDTDERIREAADAALLVISSR